MWANELNVAECVYVVKVKVKVKVKQSRYRPGVTYRGLQEVNIPRLHDNGTGWW
jgi:hypothetical protein